MEPSHQAYLEFFDARDAHASTIEKLHQKIHAPLQEISAEILERADDGAKDIDARRVRDFRAFLQQQDATFTDAMHRYRHATPSSAVHDFAVVERDVLAMQRYSKDMINFMRDMGTLSDQSAHETETIVQHMEEVKHQIVHAREHLRKMASHMLPPGERQEANVKAMTLPLVQTLLKGMQVMKDLNATFQILADANPADANIKRSAKAISKRYDEFEYEKSRVMTLLEGMQDPTAANVIRHNATKIQPSLKLMRDNLKDSGQALGATQAAILTSESLNYPKAARNLANSIHEMAPEILGRMNQINMFPLRALAPHTHRSLRDPASSQSMAR